MSDPVSEILRRLADLERRLAHTVTHGVVAAVDAEAKRVRLNLGQAEGGGAFLSAWVPYAQVAGSLFKLHIVPALGQQMTLVCPGGDLAQGMALPLTWSTAVPAPSDDARTARFIASPEEQEFPLPPTPGLRIDASSEGLVIACGPMMLVIRGDHISLRKVEGETPGKYWVIDTSLEHNIVHNGEHVDLDPYPGDRTL